MECKNCYCSINHGQFCSNACHNAWVKQDAQLSLTSTINIILAEKKRQEDELVEMISVEKAILKHKKGRRLYADGLRKEIEQHNLALQINKIAIIICMSIRDKKGTYPQFKTKYCEMLGDFMESIDTSGKLCQVAKDMKQNYEWFESAYNILK